MEKIKKPIPSEMELVLNKISTQRTGMLFWDAWQKVGGTLMAQIVEQAMKEYAQQAIEEERKFMIWASINGWMFGTASGKWFNNDMEFKTTEQLRQIWEEENK